MKTRPTKAALGLLLVALAGCVAPPADDTTEPSGDTPTREAAEAPSVDAVRGEVDEAVRAWLRKSWPTWKLYNWGTTVQVRDGSRRYDEIILAVPDGAPPEQWLQIHSVNLEDDADGTFDRLVRQGRVSLLDLAVLAKAFQGLESAGQLPAAGDLAYQYLGAGKHGRYQQAQPGDMTGGVHYGPGWPPSNGPGAGRRPTAPAPAAPRPSVFARARAAIDRVAADVLRSKKGCSDTCTALGTSDTHLAHACGGASAARAVPPLGIPCAAGELAELGASFFTATFCPAWCSGVYAVSVEP